MQFAIGNPEIVAYKNGQLHILKSGTTTLKAYQESGFNFTEGESDEIMLTIEKAPSVSKGRIIQFSPSHTADSSTVMTHRS